VDDHLDDFKELPIPAEVLQDMDEGNISPGELTLKVGCPLILLCNLRPTCNLM
jgi:hypothetical protein